MDEVVADNAPAKRRIFNCRTKGDSVPRAVEGVIDKFLLGIRLKEGVDFAVERVQVFLCSFDLGARLSEVDGYPGLLVPVPVSRG